MPPPPGCRGWGPDGRPGRGAPLTDPAEIAGTVAAYRDLGADELVLYCYGDDPAQVEALADLIR
ncbi:hypothetical protein [Actinoplanes sp. NPDC051494]|uniref:hypothetical protein n=1 Tax=Actinoplanes sp. NPDC051494 TaxID=3363907 RepID=UPI003793B43D